MECMLRGVIHEQFLERYISEVHWDSLCLQPVSHCAASLFFFSHRLCVSVV